MPSRSVSLLGIGSEAAAKLPVLCNYPSGCHAVILNFGICAGSGASSSFGVLFLYKVIPEGVVADSMSILMQTVIK